MLPQRLTKIDESTRDAHYFLDADDQCYFFGEFFGGRGYEGGHTNQLIVNLKITPAQLRANPKRARYKTAAIEEVGRALRAALSERQVRESLTFVPVPPSKAVGDPEYCDRLTRVLAGAFAGRAADVRPLLRQTISTEADHAQSARRAFDDLLAITAVDRTQLATPVRPKIVLFDDVLTTGKHFKVGAQRLREVLPGVPIVGVFVARRVLPNPFDEI